MMIRVSRIIFVSALVFQMGCKGDGMKLLEQRNAILETISAEQWERLSQKRIFFGHKSVGTNIIDGLRDIMKLRPAVKLNILESASPSDFGSPVFAHALIGTNKDPGSKIKRFLEIMENGVGREVDTALFKFCFVDIDHSTDIEALFKTYVEAVERLENQYPHMKIVTLTVPLTSKPVGIKARLKKLLGRLPWEEADNIKRNVYNDMLRERFKQSLFDLAAVESGIDDARKATFTENGRDYELLYRAYTNDGGHLNPVGRQVVAIELLRFLAAPEAR